MLTLRAEASGDETAIRKVLVAAFPTSEEAELVEDLRRQQEARVSLVAESAGHIVGHILFSPVTLAGKAMPLGLGLAPMAVLPSQQGTGVGSQLVREGLRHCQALGAAYVVVLGSPEYYGRFGFVPARQFRLDSVYQAGDAFQVLVWQPKALPPEGGLVCYAPAFARFGT